MPKEVVNLDEIRKIVEPKKPTTLNEEEETFCQELSAGQSQGKAAIMAFKYDNIEAARTKAQRLLKEERIKQRLKELEELADEVRNVTPKSVVGRLLAVYDAAFAESRYKECNEAIKMLGETIGLWKEKQKAPPMSPEQQKAAEARYKNVLKGA